MPHCGWLVDDQRYTFEEALSIARTTGSFDGFPPSALLALRQTREDGGGHLSPSGADRCHRQSILKAEHPYWLNPEKQWAAFVGAAVHKQLETEDAHTEMFLSMDIDVPVGERLVAVTLKGTTDAYDPELRRITDYKTVSEYRKFDPVLRRGADRTAADPSHVLQINLYRLLLEDNGFPVDSAQIWYVQTYKEAKRNVFDVDLWELDDIRQLATQLAEPIALYQITAALPPALDPADPDKGWLCRLCPVAALCRALERDGA